MCQERLYKMGGTVWIRSGNLYFGIVLIILNIISCFVSSEIATSEEAFDYTKHRTDITYKTLHFEVPVDHFSFANQDRFKIRYLVADQYWDPQHGPVFFYTGNEGAIDWFCNNTGFMWDIAPEFKALLVFAEHRYYGTSMPYGNMSYNGTEHLGYLSSEQALADFSSLIAYLRASTPALRDAPFIAFGGSYGGMLSAWMRMKYPHAIQGALAASAPVLFFGNLTPCDGFSRIVTQDFAREGANCPNNIRRSWSIITDMGKTASGRDTLTKTFKLCKLLKGDADVTALKEWLVEVYGNLAMVNYPYEANFLEPLPAWPIKEVCSYLQEESSGVQLVTKLSQAVNVYFNWTGNSKCCDITQQASGGTLSDDGWNFQACSEMVMPMCSNGNTDMFEVSPWNLTKYAAGCQKQFGVKPRPYAALIEYGGRNITAASNIIFSNGKLDPWSCAGVLETLSDTLISIVIADGAHHLDLRSSNPEDPQSVLIARQREKVIITQWINDYNKGKRDTDSGVLDVAYFITIHQSSILRSTLVVLFTLVFIVCALLLVNKVRHPTALFSVTRSWNGGEKGIINFSNTPKYDLYASEKKPLLM